mgnify:CR=1 FL=1
MQIVGGARFWQWEARLGPVQGSEKTWSLNKFSLHYGRLLRLPVLVPVLSGQVPGPSPYNRKPTVASKAVHRIGVEGAISCPIVAAGMGFLAANKIGPMINDMNVSQIYQHGTACLHPGARFEVPTPAKLIPF